MNDAILILPLTPLYKPSGWFWLVCFGPVLVVPLYAVPGELGRASCICWCGLQLLPSFPFHALCAHGRGINPLVQHGYSGFPDRGFAAFRFCTGKCAAKPSCNV